MSADLIVRYCAPTLAGIKTGSLFAVHSSSDQEVRCDIATLNRKFNSKGIRILPVRVCDSYSLVYLYRPAMLDKDLHDPKAVSILERFGYSMKSSDRCVVDLVRRLKGSAEFPHEIGLFLGYPPLDVEGFIRNPNEGFYEVGYWKVYSDVQSARLSFRRYRRCTEEYGRMLEEGRTLEQLVV